MGTIEFVTFIIALCLWGWNTKITHVRCPRCRDLAFPEEIEDYGRCYNCIFDAEVLAEIRKDRA